MKYKAIIFDLDDTLFDRNAAQIRVAKRIIQRFSQIFQDYNTERVVAAFLESDRLSVVDFEAGAPSDGLREKRSKLFLELLGIKEDCADVITETYVRDYPMINIPIAGAVPLVRELSTRFPIAVVSNGLPDVQYKKLEAIGLKDVFSCIVLSEEIGIRKPDPRIFQYAANIVQIQPLECLYVGDSYRNDIVGAKTAGMQACWYNCESSAPEKMDIQADFVITNIGELTGILEK